MATYRCSTCNINWPLKPGYRLCISCGEKSSGMSGVSCLPDDEAESLANHIRFERFWEARELKRLEQLVEP